MKYRVYGFVKVGVTVEVEADDEHAAIEAAENEFEGLSAYAGNGGIDRIVGTSNRNVSLDVGDYYGEFDEAEPA